MALHDGHAHIEQKDVRHLAAYDLECVATIPGLVDHNAGFPQHLCEILPDQQFVLDDENTHVGPLWTQFFTTYE